MRLRLAACVLISGLAAASAQDALPTLQTNEAEIREANAPRTLTVNDPLAVFAFVLESLPERVSVLPTENYFYFGFTHAGVPYTGNIRLAARDRDQGKVHFAYGVRPSDWHHAEPKHIVLDAAQGVTVEKTGNLTYRIAYRAKGVVFSLNDLSQVKPPAGVIQADEAFVGPIFDESGFRFFLLFNRRLKVFHYVLDARAGVPDQFFTAKTSDRIQVGKRTGFAFHQDGERKILIGVDERNSRLNTPFDGPFDQLPENFIEGEVLRDAILAADPALRGQIDRLGHFARDGDRYLIHPYMRYRSAADLAVFHRCTQDRRVRPAERARCFVIADDEAQKRNPRPLALTGR
jgi:hypothetical protein